MDAIRSRPATPKFDELHAEAASALSYSANTLRAVRDRYRQAYLDDLARWQVLVDDLRSPIACRWPGSRPRRTHQP